MCISFTQKFLFLDSDDLGNQSQSPNWTNLMYTYSTLLQIIGPTHLFFINTYL